MTDPSKSQTVVVVVVILALTLPGTVHSFSQDIQEYTQEISRRSFAMMDGLFDSQGPLMTFGYPIFIILTFVSALNSVITMISSYFGGFLGPLGMLGLSFPTEMAQARNSTEREQRLLDYVDYQVQSSVAAGQNEYENELKKKK